MIQLGGRMDGTCQAWNIMQQFYELFLWAKAYYIWQEDDDIRLSSFTRYPPVPPFIHQPPVCGSLKPVCLHSQPKTNTPAFPRVHETFSISLWITADDSNKWSNEFALLSEMVRRTAKLNVFVGLRWSSQSKNICLTPVYQQILKMDLWSDFIELCCLSIPVKGHIHRLLLPFFYLIYMFGKILLLRVVWVQLTSATCRIYSSFDACKNNRPRSHHFCRKMV